MAQTPVLVLGAGSWGTALAIQLARNGHPVWLWGRDAGLIARIRRERQNPRYLPGIDLGEGICAIADLGELPDAVRDVVFAVPCAALETVARQLSARAGLDVCLCCKGLQQQEPVFNHALVQKLLRPSLLAVLSGPSFATEVARGHPTAVSVAAADISQAEHFASLFHSETFRAYVHDDLIGVQLGGGAKNVVAIAAGVAAGLGYGSNTRAALICRGLSEIRNLGMALGARSDTFIGLSGVGDLILTCSDDQSRNRRLGLALVRGLSLDQARAEIAQSIEGIDAAANLLALARHHRVEMPITEQVMRLIGGECEPMDAVRSLLQRDLGAEMAP